MKKLFAVIFTLVAYLATYAVPASTYAVDATSLQQAKISITFDDGFLSTYTNALPVLSSRNLPATLYLTSGFVEDGQTDDGFPAMSWEQAVSLQNTYGWEIGGHSNTHPELPLLTASQIASEFSTSNALFASHGLNVDNFATPFGAYDNVVLVEALKKYSTHRGFADRDSLNAMPYNKAVLQVQSIEETTTPAMVQDWVSQAIANKQWLVLVLHDVQPTLNGEYEYTTTIATFEDIADILVSSGVPVMTVRDAVAVPGANTVANYNFQTGLTGWTTDNAAQVALDTANNGAYTDSTNSLKLTGGTVAGHLFSDLISVVSGESYLLDVFYNSIGLTSGELGFYIDEYDSSNNWISGQWLGMVTNGAVGYFDKFYNATSTLVAKLRVQTYLTANAAGSAYVDNVKLQALNASGSATPTPTVTPTVTPVPGNGNLVTNPTFDSGLLGWTTDNAAQVSVDSANHGGTPTATNSVKMTGGAVAAHLFHALLPVDTTAQYLFSAFANTTALTGGELGFYIDEYNSTGTWISGKWMGMVANGASSAFSYVYNATSTAVAQVRLQTYLTAGSTGTAYADNYSFVNQSSPTVTPSVTPSVTPTVTPTVTPSVTPTPGVNIAVNPSFEEVESGWAKFWTKDSENWTLNTASAGNDGTNSIKLTINSLRTHFFSPLLPVDSTKTHVWREYITTANLTGEFGFYIDEYDANGTWISGQWKGMLNGAFTGTHEIVYTPTSVNVASVRLQHYTVANSTGDLIIDSVFFATQ